LVTLPKGTKTINLGPGHYKFILASQIVEVTGLNPANGSFSLVAVMSRSPRLRLLWGGRAARRLNREELIIINRRPIAKKGTDLVFQSFLLTAPLTLPLDEVNPDNLISSFLALNTDDPGKNNESSDLATLAAKARCEAKHGNWNPETKKCE